MVTSERPGRLRGERGIAQVLVDTDAVVRALGYEDDSTFMLIAQAARHLGVTIPTVSHLKRLGWLTVDRKQTALRIMPALRRSEVEAFPARALSVQRNWRACLLRKRGRLRCTPT